MRVSILRVLLWSWLVTITTIASATEPLPPDRLMLRQLDGAAVPFDESLGADGMAVCFAFLHPSCPLAQDYAPVLENLSRRFEGAGVRFIGVVCECDDPAEVTAYCTQFGITFPVHLDTGFALAEALGATTTPQAVLVDRERWIRYTGRIDDRYKIRGVMTPGDPAPELAEAIDDLVAGTAVRVPATTPAGCPLDRPNRPTAPVESSSAVTFFRDVLPFLHAHCQKCHSPNQAGPFTLLTYEDAVTTDSRGPRS